MSLLPVSRAQESDAVQGEEASAVYDFATGMVKELSVLGPVSRDQEISDPAKIFGNPVDGTEFVLENGERHRWQVLRPDGDGVFRFGEFFEAMKQKSDNAIVYAALRFKTREAPRWIYVGADNGVRLWLDGEIRIDDPEPGFFFRQEHTVAIPSGDEQPLGIFEFNNHQGGFVGQVSGGYVLSKKMLAQDEVTLESNTPVAVIVEGVTTRLRTDQMSFAMCGC